MPKAASKRKAANGYKLAEPLPLGEILEDVAKKKWKLGHSIGQGGFGEIYSAQDASKSGNKYPYVIKIEPHGNGPLFVEMHFYLKYAKPEDVEAFKKQKGLKTFGMPTYLGSGSHEFNGTKYRFLVMQQFGTDLWKIFLENSRHFPTSTVFKIAIQILDILEYIHSKGYAHADVKGANILLGITKDTQNKQVYLVDFGLTTKCTEEAEFKPNPKKAHDGTIEYLSRDAHSGVHTKRGDLETLAYNIIQWLGCVLPWENNLKDPVSVQKSKEEYMCSVPKLIKACFDKRSPPGPVVDFLNCLSSLNHNSNPDYKTIRKIFLSGLTPGDAFGKPFQFTVPDKSPQKSPNKRKNEDKPSSSKKKVTKKDFSEEVSEDEKENVDELSESEEITKRTNNKAKEANRPKGKKRNARKKSKQELSEEMEDNLEDVNSPKDDGLSNDEDIEETNKKTKSKAKGADVSKGKKKYNGRKKPKEDISEENEDKVEEDIQSTKDEDSNDAIIEPQKRTTSKKSSVKRKGADNSTYSRKKQSKYEIEEVSEDKQEHFDDLSDTDEITMKDETVIIESKEKQIAKSESLEENDDIEEKPEDTTSNHESKSKQKPKGRKKASKIINGKDLEDIEKAKPVVSDMVQPTTRTTRQRGQPVNYKEDSDDEKKPTKKRFKQNTTIKEVHVTGDSDGSDDSSTKGYTAAMKKVAKKKIQNEKLKPKKNAVKPIVEEQEIDEEIDSVSSTIDENAQDDSLVF